MKEAKEVLEVLVELKKGIPGITCPHCEFVWYSAAYYNFDREEICRCDGKMILRCVDKRMRKK